MIPKILVVDDAPDHQRLVHHVISTKASVTAAMNLAQADQALDRVAFDLILLDINLPDGDGLSYFARLRSDERTREIPVIFITGCDEAPKEVMGFSLGAKDYIVKPVEPARLRARLEARLKAIADRQSSETILQRGDLRISLALQRVVHVSDGIERVIDVTPVEFKLLFHLLRYEEQVFTREQLLTAVWGNAAEVFDRTVDMHVSNLRKKIHDTAYKIISVHGTGYRLGRSAAS